MKTCWRCKIQKESALFWRNQESCKECALAYQREHRKNGSPYTKRWNSSTKGKLARKKFNDKHLKKNSDYLKKSSDKYYFGGMREVAIKRDGERCVVCNMTRMEHQLTWGRDITVDHIDGLGRKSTVKNNSLDNLQTLCLQCHGKKDHKRKATE